MELFYSLVNRIFLIELNCTGGEVLLDKSSHHVAYCAQAPCELFSAIYLFAEANYLKKGLNMLPYAITSYSSLTEVSIKPDTRKY